MSRFLQLHYLVPYPPSNPNRSASGRPKTAWYGGALRLRLSSQSLKRAVRTSEVMHQAVGGNLGTRSRRFGEEIFGHLKSKGADDEVATRISDRIAGIFGKVIAKGGRSRIAQVAFVSPEERTAALALAESLLEGNQPDAEAMAHAASTVLRKADSAVDIALFGRMLAETPEFGRRASLQVAHAFTTHAAPDEEDEFTVVDDLNVSGGTAEAGFLGKSGYGSGIFYVYVMVEISRLLSNLDGNLDLAELAVPAVVRAFATVSPSGRRTAFAHHVRAAYILAEAGPMQPRSLASAFLDPVAGSALLPDSIVRLRQTAAALDRAYGKAAEESVEMDVAAGRGSLDEIADFACRQVRLA